MSELRQIISFCYLALVGVTLLLFIFSIFFWLIFVVNRLNHYYKSYRNLLLYNLPENDMNAFNYRIKFTVYLFFLLLLISELLGSVSYCVFMILFRVQRAFSVEFNVSLNCTDSYIGLWEVETVNPFVAFVAGFRIATLFTICILITDLLKFIFQAHQFKPNFSIIKSSLAKCSCMFLVTTVPYIFPQTQVVLLLILPVCTGIVIYLLLKYKKLYFLILKWRSDDAFILRDNASYLHHSRIRRSSTISLNLLSSSLIIMFVSSIMYRYLTLILILLTDKSMYFTSIYSSDANLAFLDCHNQQIVYQVRIIVDNVIPITLLIGMYLYSAPFFAVSFRMIRRIIFKTNLDNIIYY